MESSTNQKSPFSVSELLPIGYLYLLLLGIISDSIFYSFLGINIISYSNVLDVILSPIVHLTSNIAFPTLILLLPLFLYFYVKLVKNFTVKKVASGKQKANFIVNMSVLNLWLIFTAFVIFFAYLGFGFGGGAATQKSIENENFNLTNTIIFANDESIDVKIIGNNSSYVFYVMEGSKSVTVSPIQGNIKKIEKLRKKTVSPIQAPESSDD